MGFLNNNINITGTNDLDPNFSWQVGFKSSESYNSQLQFRVTVRPLTDDESSSRIPNGTVLYEETGILINNVDRLGAWEFPLSVNAVITGGPYRSYQVVVEAHDSNGNTSAGNRVGTQNEEGWTAYPEGFDVIAVYNPRQTGIELNNHIPTRISITGDYYSVINNTYSSRQYMGGDGSLIIQFNSGTFDSDLVGGFIYTASIPFPKTGYWMPSTTYYPSKIVKTEFEFNPEVPNIFIPTAAFNVRGSPYIFASVSFFDQLDKLALDNGHDISSQLYLSNNSVFYSDAAAGTISLGGVATVSTVQTTGYPANPSTRLDQLIGANSVEVSRNSTNGTSNTPSNTTTILYLSTPLTGLGYTGFYGGDINTIYGGIGDQAIQNDEGPQPFGYHGDCCLLTGLSLVAAKWKRVSQIRTEDNIVIFTTQGYYSGSNNLIDYPILVDPWQNFTGIVASPTPNYNSIVSKVTAVSGSTGVAIYYTSALGFGTTGHLICSLEQPLLFSGRFRKAQDIVNFNVAGLAQHNDMTFSKMQLTGGNYSFYNVDIEPGRFLYVAHYNNTGFLGDQSDPEQHSIKFHDSIYNY